MNSTVLFCFKGRHGLGHTRRTLLVAEAVADLDSDLEIVLISQCRSVAMLRRSRFPVINFPVLERLPNDTVEAAFLELLGAIGEQLAPSLIVEDTFPDPRHLFLAPFREAAKVLVMSGMVRGAYFERVRQEGLLRYYDRIVIARDEDSVEATEHSQASRTLLRHSSRFRFCGPVFARPSAQEVARAEGVYGGEGVPLVVVNAGAGGDVTTQALPERLMWSMTEVAARFAAEQILARFVLVAGPYYQGRAPRSLPNVTWVRDEPNLPALLHAAQVAVIRPGSNVLREALSGSARVVLVPNFSWAEDQSATADLIVRSTPGVAVAACDDIEGFYSLTRSGLAAGPRPPWREAVASEHEKVARVLLAELRPTPAPTPNLFLLIGGTDAPDRHDVVQDTLPGVPQLGQECVHWDGDGQALLLDRVPSPAVTPAELHGRGVRLVLVPSAEPGDPRHGVNYDPGYGFDLRTWRRAYRLEDHGLVCVDVHHLQGIASSPGALAYRYRHLQQENVLPAVWLDLRRIPTTALDGYATAVATWCAKAEMRLATIGELLDHHVTAQFL